MRIAQRIGGRAEGREYGRIIAAGGGHPGGARMFS